MKFPPRSRILRSGIENLASKLSSLFFNLSFHNPIIGLVYLNRFDGILRAIVWVLQAFRRLPREPRNSKNKINAFNNYSDTVYKHPIKPTKNRATWAVKVCRIGSLLTQTMTAAGVIISSQDSKCEQILEKKTKEQTEEGIQKQTT